MKLGRYFIFKPYDTFGNRCEDIYFALLLCRRNNLKLLILKHKWKLFWKFSFQLGNLEVLEICHPLITQNAASEVLSYLMSIICSFLRITGVCWRKVRSLIGLHGHNFLVSQSEMTIGRLQLWDKVSVPFQSSNMTIDWKNEFSRKLNVTYQTRAKLDTQFPLLHGKKYICLHVRTGDFSGDHQSPRNADITNYLPAINWLASQGFIVVRLGDSSMPALSIPSILDYAHSSMKSEKNDVLMIQHCDFYMGSQSGPIDLAALFEKKILTINALSLSHCFWYREGSLFLPKRAMLDGHKFLSIREQIDLQLFEVTGNGFMNSRVSYEENNSDEILEAVQEFIQFSELTPQQKNFNNYLLQKLIVYFETSIIWNNHQEDALQKTRWMSRFHTVNGSAATACLTRYWT